MKMPKLRGARLAACWRPGGYAKASLGLFFWLALRAVSQALSVVLLTRWVGADAYGHFVVVLAMAVFFTQIASLGLQGVLLRDIAQFPERLPALLRTCLHIWGVASLVVGVAGGVVTQMVLPNHGISFLVVLLLVFSEVATNSGLEILARTEQALHNSRAYGAISAGLVMFRVLPLLVCVYFLEADIGLWMLLYAAFGFAYLGVVVLRAWKYMNPRSSVPALPLVSEGIPFAVSALAIRLQTEFNKPVLARIGYAEAGVFNVAQRVVDMATLPLGALMDTLVPRMYAGSRTGNRFRAAELTLLMAAILCGAILALFSPYLPRVLGVGFSSVVPLLQGLAWLPVLQVLRNLSNVRLVASGYARRQTGVYIFCAVFGVLATSILVSRFSQVGAVVATYLAEVFFIIALYFAGPRRQRND